MTAEEQQTEALSRATDLNHRHLARLSRCGYAINLAIDELRQARHSEEEWSRLTEEAGSDFRAGRLAPKCGKPPSILVIHRNGKVYPYCTVCFWADAAVADGGLFFLKTTTFSEADANLLEAGSRCVDWGHNHWRSVTDFCEAMRILQIE
jgi:hypothetical protein